MAKLSDHDCREIRKRYAEEETTSYGDLAKDYNVSRQAISDVVNGRRAVNLTGKPGRTGQHKKLDKITKLDKKATKSRAVKKTGTPPDKLERLENGAWNRTELIRKELTGICDRQKAELEALRKEADKVKELIDKCIGEDAEPAELLMRFEMIYGLFVKMDTAFIGLKDTLAKMAYLEKNLQVIIDQREQTVIIQDHGPGAPNELEARIEKYRKKFEEKIEGGQ